MKPFYDCARNPKPNISNCKAIHSIRKRDPCLQVTHLLKFMVSAVVEAVSVLSHPCACKSSLCSGKNSWLGGAMPRPTWNSSRPVIWCIKWPPTWMWLCIPTQGFTYSKEEPHTVSREQVENRVQYLSLTFTSIAVEPRKDRRKKVDAKSKP
jgi:hypothetical protein